MAVCRLVELLVALGFGIWAVEGDLDAEVLSGSLSALLDLHPVLGGVGLGDEGHTATAAVTAGGGAFGSGAVGVAAGRQAGREQYAKRACEQFLHECLLWLRETGDSCVLGVGMTLRVTPPCRHGA